MNISFNRKESVKEDLLNKTNSEEQLKKLPPHNNENHDKFRKEGQPYNLNDFELQNQIGSGSFGKVYRVLLKERKKNYAAKISKESIKNPEIDKIRDISREVNILSKLKHPSILQFIFYSPFNFKQKPKPVIITEFAKNKSLEDLIENEKISPTSLFSDTLKLIIIYGISSAMSYIHSHEIIHRDLKPANILLDDYFFPKIGDFGLSKVNCTNFSEDILIETVNNTIKGTPDYMAPEIWSKSEYSKASDVYAFGMIVFEIMTKNNIFDGVNYNFLKMHEVCNGYRPEFKVKIPDSYRNLIERCWSQDPKKRPSFDEILEELKHDNSYITESVNKEDFEKYVSYIDNSEISFDSFKVLFHIEEFYEKQNLSNKIVEFSNSPFIPNDIYNKLDEKSKILVDESVNDPKKMFLVGKSFVEGRESFPQNLEIGVRFLTNSIENCVHSLVYYCELLIQGSIIPQYLTKARKLIQTKLANNEELSSLLIGKILKKEKNYTQSKDFFLKSIELGNAEAMYEYGKMIYKQLFSSTNNKEEAIEYFEKSIEKGCVKAMFKYGKILMNEEDHTIKRRGINYIKLAADNGYPKATYYYALMLERGKEIECNEKESIKYLKNAAKSGFTDAMYEYALSLDNYSHKVIILTGTKKESLYYFKKASAKGHIGATYQYSMALIKGDGIPRNIKKGEKYIKIAAYKGNSDAMVVVI